MGLFVPHWGHHHKGGVQAPVVVPVGPAGRGALLREARIGRHAHLAS